MAGLTGLPAGWLWGAFLSVMIASLAGRQLVIPVKVGTVTFVFLGTMLGGSVTPETLAVMAKWPLSLVLLSLSMLLTTGSVALYLCYVHGWDRLSALFASAPGALSQSLALAASMGADLRSVSMVQSLRILVYVAGLPAILGSAMSGDRPSVFPTHLSREGWIELAWLFVACAMGSAVAERMRIPGALVVGAMVVSGTLHGSDIVHANPPYWIANVFFLLLGAMVGTRFAGVDLSMLRRLAACSLGALVIGTVVAFGCAYVAAHLLAIRTTDMFLAYVPGGMEAMTIIAFALNLDPAFVASHHLARYVLLTFFVPAAAIWLAQGKKPPDAE